MKRGEIFLVNLSPAVGTELRDLHPCVVVQSNLLEHALRPRTIVIPLTSRAPKQPFPFVVPLEPAATGLKKASYALCDQVTRIDKSRLVRSTGRALSPQAMVSIDNGLRLALDL